MEIVYVDAVENNSLGIFIKDKNKKVMFAGTIIRRLDNKEKNHEIIKNAKENHINYIFEDTIISVDFYSVPRLNIFAFDDTGYYGVTGDSFIQGNEPVYYVDHHRECFKYANNLRDFIENMGQQKDHLEKVTDISFYDSKEQAKQELNFLKINNHE